MLGLACARARKADENIPKDTDLQEMRGVTPCQQYAHLKKSKKGIDLRSK